MADKPNPEKHNDDLALFRQATAGIKPLTQDKVVKPRRNTVVKPLRSADTPDAHQRRQLDASFAFSDIYQASLPDAGPMRYCRPDEPTHSLKRLRRGDFYPELVLDLHGLTRENAKLEISALLYTARKELIDCVAIVHGIGSGVLKGALPHYLVQHPHVIAFHQAPLEYGGQGALLVLVETLEPVQ
ncbi:endonuclease SmrB [Aestuariibacter sp. A3R04]|uniref:endonuclease SmrB n=1 Tax=Aestuariibacter sp. A3R04 TaxID=2841571 RepID=UPI002091CAFA|nr:endonuclease SmrB [Aestuariibacter sp. A3R04]